MKKLLWTALVLACTGSAVQAEVKTKEVTYAHDGVTLKGYLAWDDAAKGKRPGVLVVHEWWGLGDYEKKRAEQLAKEGFVAFACDMYGEGKLVDNPKDAGMLAGGVRKNLKVWLGRAQAGLKVLSDHPGVDGKKLASIGYCFGGSTSQQLAFHNAGIQAAVSFHGSLIVPSPEAAKGTTAKLLIAHGADDSFIKEATIKDFKNVLDEAKTNYKFVSYPKAKHSFTVPNADSRKVDGLAYNEAADRQSWQDMLTLFRAVFEKK